MVDLKLIATALKEAGRADLQMQMLELSEKLREKEDRIHTLEREVRSLRETSDLKARVHPRDEMYFVRQDDGSDDGPFCTRCFDVDRKPVRLLVKNRQQPICPQCKTPQGPRKDRPPKRIVAQKEPYVRRRRGRLSGLYGDSVI